MPVVSFADIDPRLWVSFVNTRFRENDRWIDLLASFEDFVDWLVQRRVLEPNIGEMMMSTWQGTAEAERTWRQASRFRGELARLAELTLAAVPLDPVIIEQVNRMLSSAPVVTRFVSSGDSVEEVLTLDPAPQSLLYPIALTAGRTLARPEGFLLKKCANEECSRLFVDLTRNHSRRWCSMAVCGSQAKARAYYHRHRDAV